VARKVSLMHDHNLHLLHKFHNGADPDQTPQRKPSPDKRSEGRAVPSAPADKGGRSPDDSERGHSGAGSDYDPDFPHFIIIKKTDRLEERERWKGQVSQRVLKNKCGDLHCALSRSVERVSLCGSSSEF